MKFLITYQWILNVNPDLSIILIAHLATNGEQTIAFTESAFWKAWSLVGGMSSECYSFFW